MFTKLIRNNKSTKLYYHKTSRGAEYLTDKYITAPNGEKEGTFEKATIIIRIDGGELEFLTG